MRTAREAISADFESLNLNHLEVVQVPSVVSSVLQIAKPKPQLSTLQKWGYGLLIFSLLFIGIQAIRCGVFSFFKLETLIQQLNLVNGVNQQVITKNAMLKDKISLYSSPLGVEEMARERLGMVQKDEILVRVFPPTLAQR